MRKKTRQNKIFSQLRNFKTVYRTRWLSTLKTTLRSEKMCLKLVNSTLHVAQSSWMDCSNIVRLKIKKINSTKRWERPNTNQSKFLKKKETLSAEISKPYFWVKLKQSGKINRNYKPCLTHKWSSMRKSLIRVLYDYLLLTSFTKPVLQLLIDFKYLGSLQFVQLP